MVAGTSFQHVPVLILHLHIKRELRKISFPSMLTALFVVVVVVVVVVVDDVVEGFFITHIRLA